MTHSKIHELTLAALLPCSIAAAQIVHTPVRVSPNPTIPPAVYAETSIAAAQATQPNTTARVIVGAGCQSGGGLLWSASMDGGATWPAGGIVGPTCGGQPIYADPMTASSAVTGDLWLGGLGITMVVSRLVGNSLVSTTNIVECTAPYGIDKGLLAVGPGPSGQAMYCGFTATGFCGPSRPLVARRSDGSVPGTTWSGDLAINPGSQCAETGIGAAPVVIQSGLNVGRVVLAYGQFGTGDTPWVAFSDGQGNTGTWSWSATGSLPGQITHSYAPSSPGALIYPANHQHLPGTFVFHNFPSIATDPNQPNRVYVAFCGRSTDDSSANSKNVDLYVAQSTDAGATFSFQNVLHITDAMLSEGDGADQFLPAVTVDALGGVDVLFYTTSPYVQPDDTPDADVMLQARLVRIPSFSGSLTGGLQVWKLAQPFHAWVDLGTGNPKFVGDYNGACTAGCSSWFSFMQTAAASNGDLYYGIYVAKLDVCSLVADLDTNGALNAADAGAFVSAFSAGAPEADVNHDAAVDANDVAAFAQCVNCGCNP